MYPNSIERPCLVPRIETVRTTDGALATAAVPPMPNAMVMQQQAQGNAHGLPMSMNATHWKLNRHA